MADPALGAEPGFVLEPELEAPSGEERNKAMGEFGGLPSLRERSDEMVAGAHKQLYLLFAVHGRSHKFR